MAKGWLSAIQMVPWSDVVGNAPTLVAAARKLWKGEAAAGAATEADADGAAGGPEAGSPAAMTARLAAAEAAVAQLGAKLEASIAVVNALAEQNTQLVQRLEAGRRRALWLFAGLGLSLIVACAALAAALVR